MTKRIIESYVQKEYSGIRIDKYLSMRFTYLSRSQWQNEIKKGNIFIEEKKILNIHKKIYEKNLIKFNAELKDEPPVDKNYKIVYEDEYIIAVNKSGNLPVHPSGKFFFNSLSMILENDLGYKIYPIHRLDRETSGILLFSKNSEITSKFHANLKTMEKTYIAIVHGIVEKKEIKITTPIGKDNYSKIRKKRSAYKDAEESAITNVKKLFSFNKFTMLEVKPKTGRLHQIRVHLNYIGFPIVGDKLYGINENFYLEFIESGITKKLAEKLLMERCALHSKSIKFIHPETAKELFLSTELPEDFTTFINENS